MLAREIEQVQPLIDISREDRIARHPVGEFRMVERRVRMDGQRTPGCSLAWTRVSTTSVIIRSALPSTSASKIVALSLHWTIVAFCKWPDRSARWFLLD